MPGRPKTKARRLAAEGKTPAKGAPLSNAQRQKLYRERQAEARADAQAQISNAPAPVTTSDAAQTLEQAITGDAPVTTNIIQLKAGRKPKSAGASPQSLDERHEDIMEWASEGRWPGGIAKQLKVKTSVLMAWLDSDPERSRAWARAREIAASAKLELAEEMLKNAQSSADLAVARETAHHMRWLAARLNNALFGEKVDVTSGGKQIARSQVEIDKELMAVIGAARKA